MQLPRTTVAACLFALVLPSAAAQLTPYSQDLEGLDPADPAALTNDGWKIFANVFDANFNLLYGYGTFGAPNGGPGFSSLASSGNASPAQGAQQLNIYSDYANGDHANGFFIEANVFQEQFIDAANVGQTWTLTFDVQAAPPNSGAGDTTTQAFIKVLRASDGSFATIAFETKDTTGAPFTTFDCGQVSLTIDPSWGGELLQFGFVSTATNFNDSGRYYDNLTWEASATPTLAKAPRLMYSSVAGAATAAVPGSAGLTFESGSTFAFDDVEALRSDLSTMAFTAFVDSPVSTDDEILVVSDALAVREGDQPPFTDAGDFFGAFDGRVEVNSNGDFVFQNNTVGDTSTDDLIVRGDAMGNLTLVAREGSAFAPLPGTTVGSALESPNISVDGTVFYYVENVSGGAVTSATDNFIVSGTSVLVQKGITPLSGDSAGEFLDTVDFNDLVVSENGQHWLARADLTQNIITTSEDDCLIVDGEVVIRELQPLPGGTPMEIVDTIGIFGHKINNSGDWIARGDLDPPFENDDWVIMNGAVVTRTGEPIFEGSSESWSASIFGVEMNDDGDFLIAGGSDLADGDRDGVIVLNGSRVIVREGDPVDVDGNGVNDDNAFVSFFDGDNMVLGNRSGGLQAIFVASIVDEVGGDLGQGIFTIDLEGVVGSTVCIGEPNSTGVAARAVALGSTSAAANDLTLFASDLPVGSMGYFATSQETNLVLNPGGSEGNLCIASFTIGRYADRVVVADSSGLACLVLDLSATPSPTGPVAIAAGETYYWQLWYRDTSMGGTPTSNFSDAVGVTFD